MSVAMSCKGELQHVLAQVLYKNDKKKKKIPSEISELVC